MKSNIGNLEKLCNTVVIVTMDWSVRQQGFCQK